MLNRVKWGAIGALAIALADWVWPALTDVLTVLTWASWAVVAAVLAHAVPVPARLRTAGPAIAGRTLRVARAVSPPWLRARVFPWPWARPSLAVVVDPAQLTAR